MIDILQISPTSSNSCNITTATNINNNNTNANITNTNNNNSNNSNNNNSNNNNSNNGNEKVSKFVQLWLNQVLNKDETDQPFDTICSVSRTALSCLKDWLHPYAFIILLSEVISNICTLILFVTKELALRNPDILTSNDISNDENTIVNIDSVKILVSLSDDMNKIRDLFNEFHNQEVENNFFEKMESIHGVSHNYIF